MNILVLDDDLEVLDTLKMYLEDLEGQKFFFSNPEEGLKLIEETKFDLLITDIFMPNINALELITEFNKKVPRCKIIAISAGGKTGGLLKALVLDEAMNQGAHATLKKPFLREDLISKIEYVLS
jgi:DNA-binding NtrC family response regulator